MDINGVTEVPEEELQKLRHYGYWPYYGYGYWGKHKYWG